MVKRDDSVVKISMESSVVWISFILGSTDVVEPPEFMRLSTVVGVAVSSVSSVVSISIRFDSPEIVDVSEFVRISSDSSVVKISDVVASSEMAVSEVVELSDDSVDKVPEDVVCLSSPILDMMMSNSGKVSSCICCSVD